MILRRAAQEHLTETISVLAPSGDAECKDETGFSLVEASYFATAEATEKRNSTYLPSGNIIRYDFQTKSVTLNLLCGYATAICGVTLESCHAFHEMPQKSQYV